MKRRMFLSTTGTIGIVGTLSSATIANSAYTSLSTSVSLAEFPGDIKTVLNDFVASLQQNIEELGLDKNLANTIAMPVRIVGKKLDKKTNKITYKNKAGQYVSISVKDGLEMIHVSSSAA